MSHIKLAIVILNWNGQSMLEQFLPTLLEHSCIEGVTVIVADNASTDSSVPFMKEHYPHVRLIELDNNYGFAGGYNQALAQVNAEYYILLNSDVEVTPGWLIPLLEYMDAHQEVAACQPKLLDYKDQSRFEYAGGAGGYMDKWGYLFCRGRVFDTIESDQGQYDTVASLFWATGACLMIRSADYHAVGGLDDRFFAHQEEIDLCWRLRSRGRGIVCIPQSRVYHVGGATLHKSNPYKTFLNFRNNLLMLYKNLPDSELCAVMTVRFFLDVLAALIFLVKGSARDCMAVFKARRAFRVMRPSFREARRYNMEQALQQPIPERASFLLLWQYHAIRCKRFSELETQVNLHNS